MEYICKVLNHGVHCTELYNIFKQFNSICVLISKTLLHKYFANNLSLFTNSIFANNLSLFTYQSLQIIYLNLRIQSLQIIFFVYLFNLWIILCLSCSLGGLVSQKSKQKKLSKIF